MRAAATISISLLLFVFLLVDAALFVVPVDLLFDTDDFGVVVNIPSIDYGAHGCPLHGFPLERQEKSERWTSRVRQASGLRSVNRLAPDGLTLSFAE